MPDSKNNRPISLKGQSEAMPEPPMEDLYPDIFTPRDLLREQSEVKYIFMVNGSYSLTRMYEVAEAEAYLTYDDIQEILEMCAVQHSRERMFARMRRTNNFSSIIDEAGLPSFLD